jgi:hypothetical protein
MNDMSTALVKNKGGRPAMFQSASKVESLALQYFTKCDEDSEPYTIYGLSMALNTSPSTLRGYANESVQSVSPDVHAAIKNALMKVCRYYEANLSSKNVVGAIFWLKNHGWSDRQDVDLTVGVKRVVSDL